MSNKTPKKSSKDELAVKLFPETSEEELLTRDVTMTRKMSTTSSKKEPAKLQEKNLESAVGKNGGIKTPKQRIVTPGKMSAKKIRKTISEETDLASSVEENGRMKSVKDRVPTPGRKLANSKASAKKTGKMKTEEVNLDSAAEKKVSGTERASAANAKKVRQKMEIDETDVGCAVEGIEKVQSPNKTVPKTKDATANSTGTAKKTGKKAKVLEADDNEITFNFEAGKRRKSVKRGGAAEIAGSSRGDAKKRRMSEVDCVDGVDASSSNAVIVEPAGKTEGAQTVKGTSDGRIRKKKEIIQPERQSKDYVSLVCRNLPPGVTHETLKFFLGEEGIDPRVTLHRKGKPSKPILSHKQKRFKKNILQAAKEVYATVKVKTEREAELMLKLDGITMSSPTNRDWGTDLQIIRELPNFSKYKIHIRGLNSKQTEDGLTGYLKSRGLNPCETIIIRKNKLYRPRPYAFVWFRDVKECRKAVDLKSPSLGGRPLVIEHSFRRKKKNRNF